MESMAVGRWLTKKHHCTDFLPALLGIHPYPCTSGKLGFSISSILIMESTKEQEIGLLHQIVPPRLEDAGLEDCALPPDSIKEAFSKAASAVKSRAASIFSADDDACVKDPWPTAKDTSDAVIGIEPENEASGSGPCSVEKGGEIGADEVKVVGGDGIEEEEVGDKVVVVGEGGVKLGEEGKACVDDLQGLGIVEDDVKNGGSDEGKEKEGKRPTLVEGFV